MDLKIRRVYIHENNLQVEGQRWKMWASWLCTIFKNHSKSLLIIYIICPLSSFKVFVLICQSSAFQQLSFTKTRPILWAKYGWFASYIKMRFLGNFQSLWPCHKLEGSLLNMNEWLTTKSRVGERAWCAWRTLGTSTPLFIHLTSDVISCKNTHIWNLEEEVITVHYKINFFKAASFSFGSKWFALFVKKSLPAGP